MSATARAVAMSVTLSLFAAGCRPAQSDKSEREQASNSSAATRNVSAAVAFIDATEATDLRYRHFNGMSGQWYMPEMVGPGAAFFDFDGDGDLDLFIVQGTLLGTNFPLPRRELTRQSIVSWQTPFPGSTIGPH